jgi:pre-mRNA cleavage complex 2 protein Pcf11
MGEVRGEEFDEYASALSELVVNSKPIISSLTILAGEIAGTDEARASAIADLIRIHIKKSPVKSKLCGFYLLDSVVKNLRGPFVRIFAKGLDDLFLPEYAKVTEAQKKSMSHLFNTWKTVFPSSALDEIEPYLTPSAPKAAAPQPVAALAQQQWQAPAQHSVPPQWAPPAHQWTAYPAAVMPPVQQSYVSYGQFPAQSAVGMPPPPPILAGAAGGHMLANMLQSGSGDLSALIASLEAKKGSTSALAPQQHIVAAKTSDDELPAFTVDFDAKKDLGELSKRRECVIRSLYFELPLQCSQTGRRFRTQNELDAHMDWLHARRRRRKDGKVCRKWFVDISSWLKGLKTMAEDAVNFFGGGPEASGGVNDAISQDEVDENVSVPVDESQPACALSGEQFETFWNEQEQEWHYRGAIILERAIGGAKKGSIVLARAVPKKKTLTRGSKLKAATAANVKTELAIASPSRRSSRKSKAEDPVESPPKRTRRS